MNSLDINELKFSENKSAVYYNGSIWNTNKHGKIKIIGKVLNYYSHCKYYCEFEDGTITSSRMECIRDGTIRNPNNSIIENKGYVKDTEGIFKNINIFKLKEYHLWKSMIMRCYNEKALAKDTGYKLCSVSDDWLNFVNFYNDLPQLEGYEDWKFSDIIMQLDKDVKQPNTINKIYSKETCLFISKEENVGERNKRIKTLTGKTYLAINILSGESEIFYNQNDFARKWNISVSNISRCITGHKKIHKGWEFKIIETKEIAK